MCYFVVLGLPASSTDRARIEFGRGFMLHPTSNPSVLHHLPPSHQARLLLSGGCSCSLYSRPDTLHREEDLPGEPATARYRKRGWSEAKIARAARASERARAHARASHPEFSGLRPDVAASLGRIAEAGIPVALIVHWFSADLESESFAISTGPRHRPDPFLAAASSLAPDTLIWADPA